MYHRRSHIAAGPYIGTFVQKILIKFMAETKSLHYFCFTVVRDSNPCLEGMESTYYESKHENLVWFDRSSSSSSFVDCRVGGTVRPLE
jgi:hypothetical protein